MRKGLAILAALLLTGCTAFRHDSAVVEIFPEEYEYHVNGFHVDGEWAK